MRHNSVILTVRVNVLYLASSSHLYRHSVRSVGNCPKEFHSFFSFFHCSNSKAHIRAIQRNTVKRWSSRYSSLNATVQRCVRDWWFCSTYCDVGSTRTCGVSFPSASRQLGGKTLTRLSRKLRWTCSPSRRSGDRPRFLGRDVGADCYVVTTFCRDVSTCDSSAEIHFVWRYGRVIYDWNILRTKYFQKCALHFVAM